jgi:hypothetical protein
MRLLDRRQSKGAGTTGPSTTPLLPSPSPRATRPAGATRADTPLITAGRGPGLVRRPQAAVRRERRTAAARRARVLIALAVTALTSWTVVFLPGVPAWTALPATALLLTDVTLLVVTGRRRAARRRLAARRAVLMVAAAQRRAARPAAPVIAPQSGVVGQAGAPPSESVEVDLRTGAEDRPSPRSRPAEPAPPGTWTPVPVPRPTYLLKPVVPRPEPEVLQSDGTGPDGAAPAPLPTAQVSTAQVSSAQPVEEPQTPQHTWADDLDDVLARRRAVNG